MNKVMLIGHLVTKPELKQTANGISTTRFSVAVNRPFTGIDGKREVDFIPVRVWRKQAENICQYLDKGRLISVEGRLQTDSYTDKNGNKQYTWEIVANDVQFLDKTNKQEPVKEEKDENEQVDIFKAFADGVEDNFLD
jgi:single-strand DNA-binding protein